MLPENRDPVLARQVFERSKASELFPLRKGFKDTRLVGGVFEDEKTSAAQPSLRVAENLSEGAHTVEAAVQREGGVEACHFARERDALAATNVGRVGEEEVELLDLSVASAMFFLAPALAKESDGKFFLQGACVLSGCDEGLCGGIGGFDGGSLRFLEEVCGDGEGDASAAAAQLFEVADGVGRGDELQHGGEQRFAVGSGNEAGGVEAKGERGEFASVRDSGKGFMFGSAFDEARQTARKVRRDLRGGEQRQGVVRCRSPQRVEFCGGIGQLSFCQKTQPSFAQADEFWQGVRCVVHGLGHEHGFRVVGDDDGVIIYGVFWGMAFCCWSSAISSDFRAASRGSRRSSSPSPCMIRSSL